MICIVFAYFSDCNVKTKKKTKKKVDLVITFGKKLK